MFLPVARHPSPEPPSYVMWVATQWCSCLGSSSQPRSFWNPSATSLGSGKTFIYLHTKQHKGLIQPHTLTVTSGLSWSLPQRSSPSPEYFHSARWPSHKACGKVYGTSTTYPITLFYDKIYSPIPYLTVGSTWCLPRKAFSISPQSVTALPITELHRHEASKE